MAFRKTTDPVYAPNSKGGPAADTARYGSPPGWTVDGDIITRAPYVDHAQDDDWGQAGTLVREVLDDAARERLVDNVVGHLLNGVTEPVLTRAFEYWHNIDKTIGDRIEQGVHAKKDQMDPKADQQTNPARKTMQAKA
jgi:catalase